MSDKSELMRLSGEMSDAWDKILTIISKEQNRSIMVYYEGDKMAESASSICEQFSGRLDYARRQLKKIADVAGTVERQEKRKAKDIKEKSKRKRKNV